MEHWFVGSLEVHDKVDESPALMVVGFAVRDAECTVPGPATVTDAE